MRKLLAALLLGCASLAAHASTEPTMLDPVAQRRLVDLSAQLRCLVCQNQSIAESNAELAVDLRNQINEQIKAGKSDTEIVDFMVTRYGDFVLYRPPFKATTALLWIGPDKYDCCMEKILMEFAPYLLESGHQVLGIPINKFEDIMKYVCEKVVLFRTGVTHESGKFIKSLANYLNYIRSFGVKIFYYADF